MTKVFLTLAAASMILLASCDGTPDATEVKGTEAQTVNENKEAPAFKVDPATSRMLWVGSKISGDRHEGTINLADGTLTTDANNQLNGGSFMIDMTSITVTDITDADKKASLEAHLKGTGEEEKVDHFFNTKKYPTAKFEITAVKVAADTDKADMADATHMISGNLDMKGISKNITFPAKVTVTEGGIEAMSTMNIDRTEWNVNFMSEESLKDKMINKKINLTLDIKAKKS